MYSTKPNEQWRAPLTYQTVNGKKFHLSKRKQLIPNTFKTHIAVQQGHTEILVNNSKFHFSTTSL